MTLYQIKISNRNYETWQVYNSSTMEPILIDDLNPINHKLLNFYYGIEDVNIFLNFGSFILFIQH
jgi:hypothetical protein